MNLMIMQLVSVKLQISPKFPHTVMSLVTIVQCNDMHASLIDIGLFMQYILNITSFEIMAL